MRLLSTSHTDCRKSSDILSGISSDILVFFSEIKDIWLQHFWEIGTAKNAPFSSTPDCQKDTFMTTFLSMKRFSTTASHDPKLSTKLLQRNRIDISTHHNTSIRPPRPEAVKSQGCNSLLAARPAQKQLKPMLRANHPTRRGFPLWILPIRLIADTAGETIDLPLMVSNFLNRAAVRNTEAHCSNASSTTRPSYAR